MTGRWHMYKGVKEYGKTELKTKVGQSERISMWQRLCVVTLLRRHPTPITGEGFTHQYH